VGQNVAIEYRWAGGNYDLLPALAADLVGRHADVIATSGGDRSAVAAKKATATIPIVSVMGDDPVAAGLIASLARPGGNLTDVSFLTAELIPKRLELLSELVPQARVIAFLVNPNSPQTEPVMRDMQEAARVKGVSLPVLKASSESEINAAFALLAENYEPVRSWSRRSVFRRPPRSARCVSREPCNSGRFMRPVSTPRPAA